MELCERQAFIINLIVAGIGIFIAFISVLIALIALRISIKARNEAKETGAPILSYFGFLGGSLDGFNFTLKNDGQTRIKEIAEPEYNKELVGEFDITAQYLQIQDARGAFSFSKSALGPGEQCMIIFRKRNDTKPITYKGKWKVLIKYKGDFLEPKPIKLEFKVDTSNGTIIPLNFI